jgi:hypothetical protein
VPEPGGTGTVYVFVVATPSTVNLSVTGLLPLLNAS